MFLSDYISKQNANVLGGFGVACFPKEESIVKKKKIEAGELVWPSFMSEDMRSS